LAIYFIFRVKKGKNAQKKCKKNKKYKKIKNKQFFSKKLEHFIKKQ
tara:strand:- start:26 stop:163 length:138 start_codon:yes stop_codon:yes gene_type:complete